MSWVMYLIFIGEMKN